MDSISEFKLRIGEKAKELFMQYGIRSVSMDDIANALGSSKKTLYQSYTDKNALVTEVLSAILELNKSNCEHCRQVAENAIQECFLAMNNVSEMMKRLNPVFLFDLKKYHPQAYQMFQRFKQEDLYSFIRLSIEWGIKDGLFRSDIDLGLAARLRVESIDLPFSKEFHEHVKLGLVEMQEQLSYLFLFGIATPKGMKLIEKYKLQSAKK
ncbi:TetR/AcrR family transcriptional regulator [Niabella terrae]